MQQLCGSVHNRAENTAGDGRHNHPASWELCAFVDEQIWVECGGEVFERERYITREPKSVNH